ncbi:MAG: endolytic transglycosylase MltG [Candidatus Pacebacteria bacterium]|nr:endolytic transglycosylase MltG [Candidatus Paceibacterota bacterium]
MPKNLKIVVVVGFILLIGLLLGLVYLYLLFQPVDQSNLKTQRFVIPKGQTVKTIGQRLQQAGLIKNPYVFLLAVQSKDWQTKLQSGTFELSPSMSVWQIARELTQGTNDLWVTIPEGWRREELAQSLAEQDLTHFNEAEFLELTTGLEGQLFPDTYLVPKEMSTQTLVNLLLNTFEKKVSQNLASEIEQADHDLTALLTMASIVEREARGQEQMQMVADILWRRLELGMPLQVDATLQYIKGYHETQQTWWAPPTAADKKLDSPFNTYLYPGLPPRPICNPGLGAIQAVLSPQANDYLYYLHDRQGQIHYATTFEQHQQNINQYLR